MEGDTGKRLLVQKDGQQPLLFLGPLMQFAALCFRLLVEDWEASNRSPITLMRRRRD